MAIGSIGVRITTFTGTTSACFEARTTSAVRATVLEVSIIATAATAQSFGLGRPQAIGVTPTSPVAFQRDEPGAPVCVTTTALAWATSPTVPLVYHRRWNSAAAGGGIIWTFPRGLVIPVSSSVVLWNITTTIASDVNMVIDE